MMDFLLFFRYVRKMQIIFHAIPESFGESKSLSKIPVTDRNQLKVLVF